MTHPPAPLHTHWRTLIQTKILEDCSFSIRISYATQADEEEDRTGELNPELALHFVRSAGGDRRLAAELERPRFVLVPEAIRAILDFFSGFSPQAHGRVARSQCKGRTLTVSFVDPEAGSDVKEPAAPSEALHSALHDPLEMQLGESASSFPSPLFLLLFFRFGWQSRVL